MTGRQFTALLVVDMQRGMLADRPYGAGALLANIGLLLDAFRQEGLPVLYIRHDGGLGDHLERGSPGWEIDEAVAPKSGEKIFEKRFNSAFRGTGLREYLDEKGVRRLVIAGLQTEYCIDTTCKVAFEYGYEVVIPRGATTTYDSELLKAKTVCRFYEEAVWKGRFAAVTDCGDVLKMIRREG